MLNRRFADIATALLENKTDLAITAAFLAGYSGAVILLAQGLNNIILKALEIDSPDSE
jgi:hypothetical protein